MKASTDRRFVTALARGLAILRCFSRKDRELGNTEIAKRTKLPKPTVTRLTYTLTQLGYLTYSPDTGRYALSAGVLGFGHAYLGNLDVRNVARPLMQQLADDVRATVSLGAPDPTGHHLVYLEICRGAGQMFHISLDVGSRVPHGSTAMGRALLAAMPPDRRTEKIAEYRKATPRPQWDEIEEGIDRAVRDFDRYGFCLSVGDWNKDVWAVGVPMVSREGNRTLALNCSGPIFEITRQKIINEIGPRLLSLRDRLMSATGGVF